MDKAKAAVSNFLSKDGKHDTTVHERVNPAIEHERVLRTQQEEAQRVIDREVHQDHHHTSIQPVKAKEVLPEQHHHNMVGVETREHHHGDSTHIKDRLAAEAAQFKHQREVSDVQHTRAEAPVVAGEHVHHHVHETIQPIVQKETIQPSVVHTTIPVHEVHHNEAKHHSASTLPAVTMDEFRHQGGALGGREQRTDAFAGEPRSVGNTLGAGNNHGVLGGPGASGTTSLTDGDRSRHGTSGVPEGTAGPHNSRLANTADPRVDSDMDGSRRSGATGATTGMSGRNGIPEGTAGPHNSRVANAADPRVDSDRDGSHHTATTGTIGTTGRNGVPEGTAGPHNSRVANAADPRVDSDRDGSHRSDNTMNTSTTTTGKKPSLLDKLNPMTDSNRDGQKGIMK